MTPTQEAAMRQALEALEYMHQEKCDYMRRNNLGDPLREDAARLALPAITALKAALAEPVQEPVAWSYELATTMLEHGYDGWTHRITRYKPNAPEGSIRNLTPLFTAMAVKLNLAVVFHPVLNQALCRPYHPRDLDSESREDAEKHADPYAATRRAIVRAAAEIGRSMK